MSSRFYTLLEMHSSPRGSDGEDSKTEETCSWFSFTPADSTPYDNRLIEFLEKQETENDLLSKVEGFFPNVNPYGMDPVTGNAALHAVCSNHRISEPTTMLLIVKINRWQNYLLTNHRNKEGNTPLFLTVMNNRAHTVELLCMNMADTNQSNNEGLTPLDFAIFSGSFEITKILIKYKANVNHVDEQNDKITPLILAAQTGAKKIVKCLIEAGADIQAKDGQGNTALYYAEQHKNEEIKNILINCNYYKNQKSI